MNFEEKKGKEFFGWTLPAIFFTSWIIFLGTILELFLVKRNINYFISVLSLIIFTFALFLRSLAKKQLNIFYSNHIKIFDNHRVVKIGLYGWIRHPYYIFFILEGLFFPLCANAYFTFLLALILLFPLILYRCRQEEKILKEYLNNEYMEYKKSVSAFIPFKRILKLNCNHENTIN